jgi:hypothetical protein
MNVKDDRVEKLKLRRITEARERERAQLREKNGAAVLGIMTEVLGAEFRQVDSTADANVPPLVLLAERIEDSKGLVAPYISYPRARQILSCCQAVLGGEISAGLWFDEKHYMGAFTCPRLGLPQLADLAMKLEDRVTVAPIAGSGALVVDYYPLSWTAKQTDFSIVLQGLTIEPMFQNCFAQQSPLRSRLLGSME